jgi:DNA-binding GntR family transcriptional regulator
MAELVNTPAVLDADLPVVDDRAESLADRAYREIRDRLVMLDIRPGSPINEDQLGASLGIGRTPVREALKRLAHERLVVAYPRRGTFATDVHITDLALISEVRQHLEPIAAAAAARRATDRERASLSDLADRLQSAATKRLEPRELMRLDLQAHRALYAATHNPFLEDTLVRYDNLANRIWCLLIGRLSGMAGHVGEHGPLLEAVVAGDADSAAELALQHVVHFEHEVRSLL